MANIVRVDYNRFINFDDIREITSHMDGSKVECTIWWKDGENSDTFHDEQAKKIIGMAELMAIATLNDLQLEGDEDEDDDAA